MNDDLDALLSPEDRAEIAAWDADAYKLVVEVPASKITAEQLDALSDALCAAVDAWEQTLPERDWDPFIYGHGPFCRPASLIDPTEETA